MTGSATDSAISAANVNNVKVGGTTYNVLSGTKLTIGTTGYFGYGTGPGQGDTGFILTGGEASDYTAAEPLMEIDEWLTPFRRFWAAHVDALERHLDGVAGGARHVESDDALLAQQRIHQRGLAHVGPSDDGHAGALGRRLVLAAIGREGVHHQFHQRLDAVAVGRRDAIGLAQAESVKIQRDHRPVHAFRLVHHQKGGAAGAAQANGDLFVVRRQPAARIHHEEQRVGFGDGLLGLLRHLVDDAVLGDRVEAGGIDHQEFAFRHPPEAVATVAGEARKVGHQRVAGLGEAVKQGGLAHVGASNEDEGRFHATVTPLLY